MLNIQIFPSPVGLLVAAADDRALHVLEFAEDSDPETALAALTKKVGSATRAETNPILATLGEELEQYFAGKLSHFRTPVHLDGSPFQTEVWRELMRIPYGVTRSYQQQATAIGRPTAYRAVANANGANKIAIVIPCHRIIQSTGALGGYGGGVNRKKWLLRLEQHEQH